jgi:UDP-N-acetylmuramate dehydrogenase
MKITENIDLSPLSYMKIGGEGKYLIEIENVDEMDKIVEIKHKEKVPIYVLGDGSNTIFNDGFHNKIFLKVSMDEIVKTYESDEEVNINVGAGVTWDDLVEWTVKNKFSGLELLSGIPGSVGAAPIQNIGAYGAEVANTITHIKVFDLKEEDFYEPNNEQCQFEYRDSVFKKHPGRFVICNVSFRLSKKKPEKPKYRDLSLYFLREKNQNPTLRQIRKAVLDIRNRKLPDPKTEFNCGSFFKNPIIDQIDAQKIAKKFSKVPMCPISGDATDNEGRVKIPAGWLIEEAGLKGKDFGSMKIHKSHALVLINKGEAKLKDLEKVRDTIVKTVEKKFAIKLEMEPQIVL